MAAPHDTTRRRRRFALLAPAAFWGWAAFCLARGQLRWDHVVSALVFSALAYGSPRTERVFLGVLPLGLVGLFYDAMRLVQNVGIVPARVHLCDLREIERRFFGVDVGGTRATIHDWFQAHTTTALDVLCAIPYAAFIYVVLGYALHLLARSSPAQQRFAWGFFVLNLMGFLTYHLYPAAPPWYFHRYGCSVDLHAAASEGAALARVDALLGIRYFHAFYGRASDVFGAVPSLHVAYPLLMIVEGWRQHRAAGRAGLVLFYLWMCFAAAYLDHHWVVDIAAGSVYAAAVAAVMAHLPNWVRATKRAAPPAHPDPSEAQDELESPPKRVSM